MTKCLFPAPPRLDAVPNEIVYEAVVERRLPKIPRLKLRHEPGRQIDFACLDQASRNLGGVTEINANAEYSRAQVVEQFRHQDALANIWHTKAKDAGSRVRIEAGPMLQMKRIRSHI